VLSIAADSPSSFRATGLACLWRCDRTLKIHSARCFPANINVTGHSSPAYWSPDENPPRTVIPPEARPLYPNRCQDVRCVSMFQTFSINLRSSLLKFTFDFRVNLRRMTYMCSLGSLKSFYNTMLPYAPWTYMPAVAIFFQ